MPDQAAVVFALLALAGAAWSVTRAAPARLHKRVSECCDVVAEIEAQWRAERAHLATYTEELQGTLDSIERKRRQTAAAASRLNQAGGNGSGEPDLVSSSPEAIREHWTRVARSRGLL